MQSRDEKGIAIPGIQFVVLIIFFHAQLAEKVRYAWFLLIGINNLVKICTIQK